MRTKRMNRRLCFWNFASLLHSWRNRPGRHRRTLPATGCLHRLSRLAPNFPYRRGLLALSLVLPATALAGPAGEQVTAGIATVTRPNSTTTLITQQTSKAVIDWQNFSIAQPEMVRFQQPGTESIALNRVLGNDPSRIFGSLSANGQVFLVNPNGVLFAPGSQVSVHGLLATTHSLDNDDFLAGRYTFAPGANLYSTAEVVNQGNLAANAGGYIVLAGDYAANTGVISARFGQVALASGNRFTLDLEGDELIGLAVDAASLAARAGVENFGTLAADGGQVVMTAKVAGELAGTVVNNTGLVQARSIGEHNGEIILYGGTQGIVANSGTLDASGRNMGESGGSVRMLGGKVGLLDQATVDVSGGNGGGTALIGGEFQGRPLQLPLPFAGTTDPLPNAQATYLGQDSVIRADATDNGDGGRVIVWADGITRAYGNISARGGANSGDGGFVEVSGKKNLAFASQVDTAAPQGKLGTLLLDPQNIVVANGGGAPYADVDAFADQSGTTQTIDPVALNGVGASVTLQATNDITFTDPLVLATPGAGLTAQAGNDITVNAAVRTTGGAVSLTANDNGGASATGNGRIIVSGTGSIDATNAGSTPGGANIVLVGLRANAGDYGISLAGNLNAGTGGTVSLISTDNHSGINQSGGAITGDALSISANRAVSLGQNNAVNSLSGGIGNGGVLAAFTFNNTTGLNVGNISFSGDATITAPSLVLNDVTLYQPGDLSFTANAGNLSLATTKTINYNNIGAAGKMLIMSATGNLDLNGSISDSAGADDLLNVTLTADSDLNGTGTASINGPTTSQNGTVGVTGNAITFTASGDITAGTGAVNLASTGAGALTSIVAGTAISGNDIAIKSDQLNLVGTLAATSVANITRYNNNIEVQVGGVSGDGAGVLNINQAEIDNITASTYRFGDTTSTGGLRVQGTLSIPGTKTLSLLTSNIGGSQIVQNGGATITADYLRAQGTAVTLTESNAVGTLAGKTLGQDFRFTNAAALAIGSVDGQAGIDAGANNIWLEAAGLSQSAGSILKADGAKLVSNGNVVLQQANLANKFAATMSGASLDYWNAQALAIDTVGAVNGISGTGDVPIKVKTTSGDLTVTQPVGLALTSFGGNSGAGYVSLTAAGRLNINNLVQSNFNASPGGPVKLTAGSTGINSIAAGGIWATDLSVVSGGSVNLDTANNNQVTDLAASISGDGTEYFYFKNTGNLDIDTVNGVAGIGIANIVGNYTSGSSDGVVALDTTGNLTQSAIGGLSGAAVWARSTTGSVTLDIGNVTGVVAGSAATNFSYASSNAISLQDVAGHTGISAGGTATLASASYAVAGTQTVSAPTVVLTAGNGINVTVADATTITATNGSVGVPTNNGVSITSTSATNAGLSLQVDQTQADTPTGSTGISVSHNGAITAAGAGIKSRNVAATSGDDIILTSSGPTATHDSKITASAGSPIKTYGSGQISLIADEIAFPINAVSADTTNGLVALQPDKDNVAWALDTTANCAAAGAPCYDIASLQLISANTLYLGNIDGTITGNLTFNSPVAFTNSLVGIGTWGTIGQAGGASISADTLALFGKTGISLATSAHTVNSFAALSEAGNIAFKNSQTFTIPQTITDPGATYSAGVGTGGGNVTLTADTGDINIPGQITAGAGTVTLTSSAGRIYGSGTSPDIIGGSVSVTANGADGANLAIDGANGLHIQSPIITLNAPAGSIDVRTMQATTLNGASALDDISVIPLSTAYPLTIGGTVSAEGSITLVGSSVTQNANIATISSTDFVSVSATTGNIAIDPGAVTSTAGAAISYSAPSGTVTYINANFSGATPSITQYVAPAPEPPPPPPPSLDACTTNPTLAGCSGVLPSLDTCTSNPAAPGCTAVLPTLDTCTMTPAAAGCTAVLPSVDTCTATPTAPGCTAVLPPLTDCASNPALPGCTAVLPSIDTCTATPTAPGCTAVLPPLADCASNPTLAGCTAVLPSIDTCTTTPTAPGCTAVLPPLADCASNPTLAGCTAVLPSIDTCTATPTAPGCTAVLPPLADCSSNPALPGCTAVLPSIDTCTTTPTAPGCTAILPSMDTCTATPTVPGCTAILPPLTDCSSNPALPGCKAVLPSINTCTATPTAPGCGAVLPPLTDCTTNPALPGCTAVLPSIDTCSATPTAPGCTAVLPTIITCTATPTAPGCTAVLPPLADCTTNPALAGCTAVLPPMATCATDPTLPGCTAVLPPLATCVTDPTLPGCTAVLPLPAAAETPVEIVETIQSVVVVALVPPPPPAPINTVSQPPAPAPAPAPAAEQPASSSQANNASGNTTNEENGERRAEGVPLTTTSQELPLAKQPIFDLSGGGIAGQNMVCR